MEMLASRVVKWLYSAATSASAWKKPVIASQPSGVRIESPTLASSMRTELPSQRARVECAGWHALSLPWLRPRRATPLFASSSPRRRRTGTVWHQPPAELSMYLWQKVPAGRRQPPRSTHLAE
jgi:hypothetical protein